MDYSNFRAARAARSFPALLLTAALASCACEPAAENLPALDIDPARITVAGLSSGAYMATQAHLAFSDHVAGAALVAGGPYGCAGGDLERALGPCMKAAPRPPEIAALAAGARERAVRGALAPLSGLAGDRVLVLHGREDATVAPAVGVAAYDFYAALQGDLAAADATPMALLHDDARAFGHVWPTDETGADCVTGGSPWLGRCGFDGAGLVFEALYGAAPSAPPAQADGELRRFDQNAYRSDGADALLGDAGFLYLPPACASGERCGLLIAFHGCEQSIDQVGEAFARNAGLNRWADVYGVAVLYPQARASFAPLNPKACWDWWGYTGADYDTRNGPQLKWLARATAALGAPLE